jgi:hypothetical protein
MNAETALQNEIRAACSEYGIVVRCNVGVFQTADGRYIDAGAPRGFPDLEVILDGGRVAFIEVKTPTGRVRPEQARFMDALAARRHIVGVARSVADAIELCKKER